MVMNKVIIQYTLLLFTFVFLASITVFAMQQLSEKIYFASLVTGAEEPLTQEPTIPPAEVPVKTVARPKEVKKSLKIQLKP